MLDAAHTVTTEDLSTHLWVHVMVAYAASCAFDHNLVQQEIDLILKTTNETELSAALKHILLDDFQTWTTVLMSKVKSDDVKLTQMVKDNLKSEKLNILELMLIESYNYENCDNNNLAVFKIVSGPG